MEMLIILQARMNSSRLPGKILMEVCGLPSIVYQVNRLKPILSDEIGLVVATTKTVKDDQLCSVLEANGIPYFRGDEDDVLKRFSDCTQVYESEYVTRLNADCPLICPKLVSKTFQLLKSNPAYDYASTILDETYPLGMHVEVMRSSVIKNLNARSLSKEEREHVTPFIYRNRHLFKLLSVKGAENHSQYRVTVDYQEDLEVIRAIAEHFGSNNFYCEDIVSFLDENPSIAAKNQSFMKKQTLA